MFNLSKDFSNHPLSMWILQSLCYLLIFKCDKDDLRFDGAEQRWDERCFFSLFLFWHHLAVIPIGIAHSSSIGIGPHSLHWRWISLSLSLSLSLYVCLYEFIYVCIFISFYLSMHFYIYLSLLFLSISLSMYVSFYLPIYLSISLSMYVSFYVSIYLCEVLCFNAEHNLHLAPSQDHQHNHSQS